jgi:hypothetical protein
MPMLGGSAVAGRRPLVHQRRCRANGAALDGRRHRTSPCAVRNGAVPVRSMEGDDEFEYVLVFDPHAILERNRGYWGYRII